MYLFAFCRCLISSPNQLLQDNRQLPLKFDTIQEYVSAMKPLLIEELKAEVYLAASYFSPSFEMFLAIAHIGMASVSNQPDFVKYCVRKLSVVIFLVARSTNRSSDILG